MEAVPMRETRASLQKIVLPKDTNPGGTLHGGCYLTIIDETAYCAAMKFCRKHIVTVRFDGSLNRIVPVGNVLKTDAMVIHAGRTSMLVRVILTDENMRTGEICECARCYFLCVAVDDDTHKPVPVPKLLAETEEEQGLCELGEKITKLFASERQLFG